MTKKRIELSQNLTLPKASAFVKKTITDKKRRTSP